MRLRERAKNRLKVPAAGGREWKNAFKFRQMRNCKVKRTRRNRKDWEGLIRVAK
jgi:hypothetical protein